MTQASGYWRRKDSENPSFPSLFSCIGSEKNSSQLPHNQHDPPSSRHPHISAYVRTFLRRAVSFVFFFFFFFFFNLSGAYKIVWVRDTSSHWKVHCGMKRSSVAAPKTSTTWGKRCAVAWWAALMSWHSALQTAGLPSSGDEMEPASRQPA